MSIIINKNHFYIQPADSNRFPQKAAALINLNRITEVMRRNLPYSQDRRDEYSGLTQRDLWKRLKTEADHLHSAFPQDEAVCLAFKKVNDLIHPTYFFPELPEEINEFICEFLPIRELGVMAQVCTRGRQLSEKAFVTRARAYRQPAEEAATAKYYLQKAFCFIKRLIKESEFVKLMEGQFDTDVETTFKNLQSLNSNENEIQTFLSKKLFELCEEGNYESGVHEFVNVLLRCGARLDFKHPHLGMSILHVAAEKFIPMLLEKGADPNIQNERMEIPLYSAVRKNFRKETIAKLLEYGADPNKVGQDGKSCLFVSIDERRDDNPESIELMLKAGANSNLADQLNNYPLHRSVAHTQKKITKTLLKHGADPKVKNDLGNTPLHITANIHGIMKYASMLLDHGADPNAVNNDLFTPLHLSFDNPEFMKFLVSKKADVNLPALNQMYPLHSAVRKGLDQSVLTLLKLKAKPNVKNYLGETPLHLAVEMGESKITSILLKYGANANETDNEKLTPLHLNMSNPLIVELLAGKGANLELPGRDQQFLLHLAVLESTKSLKILLKHRVSLNVQDNSGQTPLHSAVIIKNKKAVSLLLSHRANPNIGDNEGFTPLHHSICNPEILELLASSGADVNSQDHKKQTPLHWAVIKLQEKSVIALLNHRAELDIPNHAGETPLFEAVRLQNEKMTSLLLERGADPHLANKNGMTPLFLDGVKLELKELLIDFGADINHTDTTGSTALHHAVLNEDGALVNMLLNRGADPTIVDAQGQRPFQLTRNEKIREILSHYE
jgi:ankyrin repeat protein